MPTEHVVFTADVHSAFNVAEAALWASLALALGWKARCGAAAYRRVRIAAAVSFAAFAGTDVVELHTGSWCRPFWLAACNAFCVAALLGCYLRYRWLRK